MSVTPNTVVHFLNVPLENNYKNQIYFDNRSSQTTFMMTRRVKSVDGNPLTFSNLTYQRKDNVIRVPLHIDQMINANYVMYQNSSYTDRWFYAFITKMEYVNDGRTDVYIETDVWQTWFDRITLKKSFVEREHVEDDSIGEHIVDEGLQLGDYVCNLHTNAGFDDGKLAIVVGSTQKPDGTKFGGTLYHNIYSGLKYFVFENSFDGVEALEDWLKSFSEDGANESIQCMFLAPQKIAPLRADHIIAGTNVVPSKYINYSGSEDVTEINTNINMTLSKLDGYTPKNNKLLTFPFRYLIVSNNNGVSIPFHYEQFYNTVDSKRSIIPPEFKISYCLTPGCSIRMVPLNYKGISQNDEEGINLGKFPALNWTSDYFTNWLTQNAVNIGIDAVQTIASGVIPGAIAGGLVGGVVGGVVGIASTLSEVYKASLVPPQSHGNINCGDVITASGKNDFHFYDMSIKRQYAEILDNYFEMYGYKVNTVKVPKLNTRPYWNYIKTINVNLDGQCPSEDLTKIREMFNNGVTFWKNGDNVENYSLNNH